MKLQTNLLRLSVLAAAENVVFETTALFEASEVVLASASGKLEVRFPILKEKNVYFAPERR